jgi:hypothetical protein
MVSCHPTITAGTYTDALHTLRLATTKCYATAQTENIWAYNAKAIEANLSKIAAHQFTEECTKPTAIAIHSKEIPTPCTVGATIDARIQKTQHELEKQLQSLEQKLAHEKQNASFECHLTQHQTPGTVYTGPQVKDSGALLTAKKIYYSYLTPLNQHTQTLLDPTHHSTTPKPQLHSHNSLPQHQTPRGMATIHMLQGHGRNHDPPQHATMHHVPVHMT